MKLLHRAAVAALVVTTAVSTAGPAFAVVPSNDTYAGRTPVSGLPFTQILDTTEATTDADDAELNAQCGAPATDASVWYDFTATADGGVVVNMLGSDYTAGAIVATGSPASDWSLVACGPDAVGFPTVAGETYTILVFDDQFDGAGNGGTLNLTIDLAPPTPTIDVTVNRFGTFNSKTGAATISGTVTCEGEAQFAFLEVNLRQDVGRFTIRGFNGTDVTCDGVTRPWTLEVVADNGKFAGGKALSVTFAVACGLFECGIDFEERTVQLRRK